MKRQKNTNELISEMKVMLNESDPKLTMENMIFSDMSEEDLNGFGERRPEPRRDEPEPQEFDEPTPDNGTDITQTINKIRQIALQAIAKLADNPTSKEYDIMKRIWNICDKSFETKEKNVNGE